LNPEVINPLRILSRKSCSSSITMMRFSIIYPYLIFSLTELAEITELLIFLCALPPGPNPWPLWTGCCGLCERLIASNLKPQTVEGLAFFLRSWSGSITVNLLPAPGSLSTSMRPSRPLTKLWQTYRPRPVPPLASRVV